MKKVFIILVGLIIIITAGLSLFVKLYVTPDKIMAFVIPAAEESLGRKVSAGSAHISLSRGIRLLDFSVKEADQTTDFIRFQEFILKFKLLPLLSRKVIVDEIRLSSPEVSIIRDRHGTYNFETLGKKEEEQPAADTTSSTSAGLPLALLVNSVAVSDAHFSFQDMMNELPDASGTAGITLSLQSTGESTVSSEGRITLSLDTLTLKNPVREVHNLGAGLDYALAVNLDTFDIRINQGDLMVQDIAALITGELRTVRESPGFDLSLILPRTGIRGLLKLASLFTGTQRLETSGDIAADARITGKLDDLNKAKAKGDITLSQAGLRYENRDLLLDGTLTFDNRIMNFDLSSTFDKNSATLKGSVKNFLGDQDITLNVTAKHLILDQLIPAGSPSGTAVPSGSASGAPSPPGTPERMQESEPLHTAITVQGDVRVDTARYQDMEMSEFFMQYAFRDNKLEIHELSGLAGKGKLDLSGQVDFSKKGYVYSMTGNVDSLHAEEVVNSFFPDARDTLFGMLTFKVAMHGAGTLADAIKRNVSGKGDFTVRKGKFTGTRLTKSLSAFVNIPELETIELTVAEGTMDLANGRARIRTVVSSPHLSLDPKGTIGLDQSLDLAFDLKLSPRLTDKAMTSKITKYIKNEDGWGTVPLIVSGTLDHPLYAVDLEKAGKEILQKKVDKYIDKLFEKKDEEKQKELEPVKELLKGLFNQ